VICPTGGAREFLSSVQRKYISVFWNAESDPAAPMQVPSNPKPPRRRPGCPDYPSLSLPNSDIAIIYKPGAAHDAKLAG
jgi:hypothetical protein